MKVTLILADSAQAVKGKLYILGGGWSVVGPKIPPMAVAFKIEVPWDEANKAHAFKLVLLDADGNPVKASSGTGEKNLEIPGEFTVGRPHHHIPGTPLDVVYAINFGPLPLKPGSRYVWTLFINDETHSDWRLAFSIRPEKQ